MNPASGDARAKRVGAAIRKRRQVLNLEQRELAGLVGVHVNTVQKWEKGTHYPGRKLGKLEAVLGITLDVPEPEADPEWLRDLHDLISDTLPPHRAARIKAAVDAVAFEDEGEPKRRRAGGGG